MNILYVIPSISRSSRGIFKKQYDKMAAFEKAGCKVRALFFGTEQEERELEKNIYHVPLNIDSTIKKYSKTLIWRILPYASSKRKYQIINAELSKHLDGIDLVYIRYSSADIHALPLLKLLKSKGKRIAFEYNGNHMEDEKVRRREQGGPFTFYSYYNEKLLQGRMASYADVLIGVTEELTAYYSRLNPKAAVYTLSNGVESSRFPIRNPIDYDGETIKFLFLSGSVNYWHGLDRFLNGLKNYKGNKKIVLTVSGPVHAEYKQYSYNNPNISVHFQDSVEGPELDLLFNTHHIGIGSLSLHKMSLSEASVLKVREYIVRGLPFIIAYNDTDLYKSEEMRPFYMQLPANDSPVDIMKVIIFCEQVLSISNYCYKLRVVGTPLVEYQPKIDRLIKLLSL